MLNKRPNQSFIVAVASGKGGVGKSLLTVNTAEVLVQMGYKVAVVDADLGLSNCAALVNESIPGTVMDVMQGRSSIDDIILKTEGNYTLVTGADEPDADTLDWSVLYPTLDAVLRKLRMEHDFVLIDTPAGASDLSFWALDRADMGILIVVGEPTAISDVYRFCKFVLDVDPTYPFGAVVNFAEDEEDAQHVLHRFNTIVNHFMNREFPFLGFVPMDDQVRKSVNNQFPIARSHPDSYITNEFKYIASALVGLSENQQSMSGFTPELKAKS
jgi:flagellar biosynthesis protein FlhG